MNLTDIERAELDRVVESLGRNTRPGRLLAHLGEKTFQGQEAELTEFHIATQVFGRSPKTFIATDDAVVRVEAHRLRKKLRDLYEKESGGSGVQISLPAGSYVPKFERVAVEEAGPRRRRKWPMAVVACVLAGAAIAGLALFMRSSPAPLPPVPVSGVTEVHLMAGSDRSEVIDDSGVHWTADRYFKGGTPWANYPRFIRRTSRPFLYANYRTGEFQYDIPAKPGVYELHLFFLSTARPGEEVLSAFNVALGGKPLLTAFDPNIDAMGVDVADERVFRDVVPDADGLVRLAFMNAAGTPGLNGIELVPGTFGKLRPIRIITQAASFVDRQGRHWRADDYYLNGVRSMARQPVSGTDDPELFGMERYGHFSYAIPVDTRGRYTVILHFAEFYFGPKLPGDGGTGSRVFHVYCNGKALLEDFDIYKEGGSLNVVTRTFEHIRPSAQGKINLLFEPVVNNASVSGIEVLEE
ncbi:MAG TPA: malectin [Steroidobacteraceae bacterium]|nr:malectin [Steroidobacteraceae bacterium]